MFLDFVRKERIKAKNPLEFDGICVSFLDQYHRLDNPYSDYELIDSLKNTLNPSISSDQVSRIISNNVSNCSECNSERLLDNVEENFVFCQECGSVMDFTSNSSGICVYHDDVDYSTCSYQRINHLKEYLKSFQARETTPVPYSTLEKIMKVILKWGFRDSRDITYETVKKAQKSLKLKSSYTVQIWCRLTGRKPLILTPQAEEKIKSLFKQMQKPF